MSDKDIEFDGDKLVEEVESFSNSLLKLKTKKQFYIAVFHYFATGEGWHLYMRLMYDVDADAAKNRFVNILHKKWGSTKEFINRFVEIESINKFDSSKYPSLTNLLKNVVDTAKMDGMIDGEFELYYSYNLS
jgi:hypothetical protein